MALAVVELFADLGNKDWVIVTKVGEEFDNGESHFDFSPAHTRRSVERSLQRLGTDYLDVVLVHSDGNDLAIVEQHGTLEALAKMKQEGLIRAFGLSGKTVEGGLSRSEEHTSELQSRENLVCRLLLEK